MDRNLALEFVRVTEAAAIAAAKWIGYGDGKKADGAAVDEMRDRFNQIDFKGTVVIGEGAKDEAPELYQGEKVGKKNSKGPAFDLAIDPLECTDSVAYGRYNAMSVIVAGAKGSLMAAPDTYMEKIATGSKACKAIDLDAPAKVNIQRVAKALGKDVREVVVMILDRPRHQELVKEVRKTGARIRLFSDGDVAAGIATCLPESGIDLLMGIGGSTEAVLKAGAIKILGGQLYCRFHPRNEEDIRNIKKLGASLTKVYSAEDLAKGKVLTFTATGIIDSPLLQGVRYADQAIVTHSIVIRGQSGTIRYITTHHHQNK